jgi:hypothetical protein
MLRTAARRDREVADLVDNEKCSPAQMADSLTERAIVVGLGR